MTIKKAFVTLLLIVAQRMLIELLTKKLGPTPGSSVLLKQPVVLHTNDRLFDIVFIIRAGNDGCH